MSKKPTVFLIDDDVDDQEIFCLALSRADETAECVCANDGINALEIISADENFKPDFIFIDLNMPRMDGSQCLSEIKKIDRLKDVPVYIYSTASDPNSVIENKKLGAEDFIVKPSDINILTRTLSNILKRNYAKLISMIFLLIAFSYNTYAQNNKTDTIQKVNELKKLSVEELTNIEVTSVTKTPQTISEVASAIQVVTGDEIRRSSVTRLPEALRLASNMQVAQSGSHDWGITARGFNGLPVSNSSLANKLLVLIDGRSVYTPLFGGVFWDVQNVLLEDLNRLEVVSGPGGTAWGANAVNGVVNIITKNAKETQGVYASASAGSFLEDKVAFRYGGQIDSALYFRVYGQHFDYNNTTYSNGIDAGDGWSMNQGGFRMDYYQSANNTFTFQGDVYDGEEDDSAVTDVNGQNLIIKWRHDFSKKSGLHFKYYIDRTFRNSRSSNYRDIMVTNDFEFQHNFFIGERNQLVWGLDYKLAHDDFQSTVQQLDPPVKQLTLSSVFIQDQISLVPHKWELTIGTKLLHNNYTDLEYHPTIRIAFTPNASNTLWAAVSHAVRTPTRIDVEYPSTSFGDFNSEKVLAYELGYHARPLNRLSFSLATYYNDYSDLRSLDTNETPPPSLYFANHLEAKTYGFELSANYDITSWWKLRGGYTYLHEKFNTTDPHTIPNSYVIEAIDPKFWFNVQSIMNVGQHFQVDAMLRYVDKLPSSIGLAAVDAYFTANLRVAYQYKWCTLSVTGKNLIEKYHIESGTNEIPRGIIGKISVNF